MPTLVLWLVAGFLLGTPVCDAQDAIAEKVIFKFRPTGDVSSDSSLFRLLGHYFEARTVRATRGTAVNTLIRRECGTVQSVHLAEFARLNPGIREAIEVDSVDVRIPPCPVWTPDYVTVVPQGAYLSEELYSVMGTAGPKTVAAVKVYNPALTEASFENPVMLSGGARVRLPYAVAPTTWRVKTEFAGKTDEILRTLRAQSSALSAELDEGQVDLVREISPAADTDVGACKAPDENWPFNRMKVLAQLQRNEANFGNRKARVGTVVIGLADTGVELADTARLPLHISALERLGTDEDDQDRNGYRHDIFGAELHRGGGFPIAYRSYVRSGHGVGVAGLAAGSILSDALADQIKARVALKILSLVQRTARAGNVGPIEDFQFPEAAVAAALKYRPSNQELAILNLSIESTASIDAFEDALRYSQTLAIIAAGNSGVDLDHEAVFPASYGRGRQSIVTVASHNPLSAEVWASIRQSDNAPNVPVISNFSNFGSTSVDLAAPGCQLETFGPNASLVKVSGTSFAAPVVTLTAALLKSEGITWTPAIRARLIASVDPVPGLKVLSRGVLNVEKALSVFEDLVHLRSGEILRGRLIDFQGVTLDKQFLRSDRVVKITPGLSGKARVITADRNALSAWDGTLAESELVFRPTGESKSITISYADVWDVVLAAQEYRIRVRQ